MVSQTSGKRALIKLYLYGISSDSVGSGSKWRRHSGKGLRATKLCLLSWLPDFFSFNEAHTTERCSIQHMQIFWEITGAPFQRRVNNLMDWMEKKKYSCNILLLRVPTSKLTFCLIGVIGGLRIIEFFIKYIYDQFGWLLSSFGVLGTCLYFI